MFVYVYLVKTSAFVCNCFGVRASRIRSKLKNLIFRRTNVVEPLLSGIVLGLIPITLAGLFVAAYMQYKRGDQLGINK